MTFGLESRALALSLVLSGLLGWLALHEYKAASIAETRCETRLAAQANEQSTVTATDQHKADSENIAALQRQIQQLQSDNDHAAAIKMQLQARLHDQHEVLSHVLKTAKPGDCLTQRVPAALVDSLHAGADRPAEPPGRSHPLRR